MEFDPANESLLLSLERPKREWRQKVSTIRIFIGNFLFGASIGFFISTHAIKIYKNLSSDVELSEQ